MVNTQTITTPSLADNAVAGLLLASVGAVFVFKYSARVTDYPSVSAGIFFAGYLGLLRVYWAVNGWLSNRRLERRLFIVLASVLVLGSLLIVTMLPEESRVGRLPALYESIGRLLSGEFPWGESAVTRPSGFPSLLIFALPFYLMGNPGLLEVVGVVLFVSAVSMRHQSEGNRLLCLLGLLALPAFYFELIVRSELFFNMSLFVFLIVLSERYLDVSRVNGVFVVLASLFGLCLSTRLITFLIFSAWFLYRFRRNLLNGLVFAGLSLFMFVLTLLPFLLWDSETFFLRGPFTIQMSYLPPVVTALFIFAAILFGWTSPTLRVLLFSLGALLFAIVFASFLLTTEDSDYLSIVLHDGFDISYLIFSVPFLLLSMEKDRSNHTQGIR